MGSRWHVCYAFSCLEPSQLFSRNASSYAALVLGQDSCKLQLLPQTKMIPPIVFDLTLSLFPTLLPIRLGTHCGWLYRRTVSLAVCLVACS